MTERALRVLVLEDSAADAELVQTELTRRGLDHEARWTRTRDEFTSALAEFKPDVVLADWALPQFGGLQALELVRRVAPEMPCIVVSGSIGEERAVEAIKQGASDYILKSRLARLVPAVERAVREADERAERRRVEQQFLQAQKMEAIGELAGGIAHDFNNLLMVISGYVDMTLGQLPSDSTLREPLEEVRKAGERAASLTQQLLAFSRRQIISPRVLDLNAVVSNMDRPLRRVLREDVDLLIELAPDAGHVLADPGQLEQVLMNLAVNARDAMPDGGKLIVETHRVELTERDAARRLGLQPGPHVMLAVSDTGTGMDAATQARIFEPFFTTKGEGKGTGLGLATVHGIVKQSGGAVTVYSEPGHGTTFRIYFPVVDSSSSASAPSHDPSAAPRGRETILLVEDNDQLRRLTKTVLERQGYRILEASHPDDALAHCRSGVPIDLLLTDVVMPGMNGRVLAERALDLCAGLRVIYMSGYTENAIVRNGVLDHGIDFLQKPFLPEQLARRVREVLDAGR
jgi:two-component system cell cycle sensor histidine kinase/response regulator CckA